MHGIQGGGYSKAVPNTDASLVDGSVTVTDEEAVKMTRLLAKKEGIFAGFSSGANFMAAAKLLQGAERGKNIGIVINDCGLKYMSTNLWG
jgi:cysteine synthase A